jgi:hypothetical protein
VNDAPVAVADVAATNKNTPITIDVLENDLDVDGDTLTLVAAAAANGTVTIVPTEMSTFEISSDETDLDAVLGALGVSVASTDESGFITFSTTDGVSQIVSSTEQTVSGESVFSSPMFFFSTNLDFGLTEISSTTYVTTASMSLSYEVLSDPFEFGVASDPVQLGIEDLQIELDGIVLGTVSLSGLKLFDFELDYQAQLTVDPFVVASTGDILLEEVSLGEFAVSIPIDSSFDEDVLSPLSTQLDIDISGGTILGDLANSFLPLWEAQAATSVQDLDNTIDLSGILVANSEQPVDFVI